MRHRPCTRERDVLLAAVRGWASAADADLAFHVAGCARCLELTAAAEAMRVRCARDIGAASPPSAAIVWWRLDRRIRVDRARAARRPLTLVHAIAGAVAIGLVLALAQVARPYLGSSLTVVAGAAKAGASAALGWSAAARTFVLGPQAPVLDPQWIVPLALMALAILLLAPTIVYLGLAED